MLPIAGRMQRLSRECTMILDSLNELKKILNSLDEGSNLTDTVGAFVIRENEKNRMDSRRYAVLADDAHQMVEEARKVCTGELSVEDAKEDVQMYIEAIQKIYSGILTMAAKGLFDK